MGNNTYIAVSGASTRQRELDVVAHNIANVGTPGFKRSESVFRSTLESSLRNADGRMQAGAPASAFVATAGVGTDYAEGAAERTGSPLHAAIDGPGFFEVETPRGLRYTRGGNFSVNRAGELALPSGEPVQGEGGPIAIPDGFAEISRDGSVNDSQGNLLGRIPVYDFGTFAGIKREGLGLYAPPEGGEKTVVPTAQLVPGSVEASNVQASKEMATLIQIQRAFETNMQVMKVDDESTQRLIEGIR